MGRTIGWAVAVLLIGCGGGQKPATEKGSVRVSPKATPKPEKNRGGHPPDAWVTVGDLDEEDEFEDEELGGQPGGVPGGLPGGVSGGVLGGTGGPPPPPPASGPKLVPQKALDAMRISGVTTIIPDRATTAKIAANGKRVVTSIKLCVDDTGVPNQVKFLRSSGYSAYDKKIADTVNDWRYKPFKVNGNPIEVCTSVTFIYTP